MVVGKREVLVPAHKVEAEGAQRDGRRRRCAIGTRDAAVRARRARACRSRCSDYGACSRRRARRGLAVRARIGADRERGRDGWVYKVGRRAGSAGRGRPRRAVRHRAQAARRRARAVVLVREGPARRLPAHARDARPRRRRPRRASRARLRRAGPRHAGRRRARDRRGRDRARPARAGRRRCRWPPGATASRPAKTGPRPRVPADGDGRLMRAPRCSSLLVLGAALVAGCGLGAGDSEDGGATLHGDARLRRARGRRPAARTRSRAARR